MADLTNILIFAKSASIGLLVGLERERHPESKAGLRTFTLIALAGTLFACIGQQAGAPWSVAAGLLVVGGMLIAAYGRDGAGAADPGTTTVAAAVVTYGLGAMLWYGQTTLAIALAVATTALLYFRAELHGVTQRLSRRDMVSFLQFAVLAFVLLPVLPDETLGPYGALNPYRMGLLVVLITGLSLAGYVALRLFGERQGILLAGLFGGLASSTATTLVYSRHARNDAAVTPLATVAILVANLVLFLRVAVLALVVSPAVFRVLLPILGSGLLTGTLYAVWCVRRCTATAAPPHLDVGNPVELRAALAFAALFTVVLVAVNWLNELFGVTGVYGVAALSGLTDLDAISLSTLQLANVGGVTGTQAAVAIVIAYLANLVFKLGLAGTLGTRQLLAHVAGGFFAAGAGVALALALVLRFAKMQT
jgi:uncharacterized membrane protein (DUF4010 family)